MVKSGGPCAMLEIRFDRCLLFEKVGKVLLGGEKVQEHDQFLELDALVAKLKHVEVDNRQEAAGATGGGRGAQPTISISWVLRGERKNDLIIGVEGSWNGFQDWNEFASFVRARAVERNREALDGSFNFSKDEHQQRGHPVVRPESIPATITNVDLRQPVVLLLPSAESLAARRNLQQRKDVFVAGGGVGNGGKQMQNKNDFQVERPGGDVGGEGTTLGLGTAFHNIAYVFANWGASGAANAALHRLYLNQLYRLSDWSSRILDASVAIRSDPAPAARLFGQDVVVPPMMSLSAFGSEEFLTDPWTRIFRRSLQWEWERLYDQADTENWWDYASGREDLFGSGAAAGALSIEDPKNRAYPTDHLHPEDLRSAGSYFNTTRRQKVSRQFQTFTHTSKFCLVVPGSGLFTTRFAESVVGSCIPLLKISTVPLPFARTLDWCDVLLERTAAASKNRGNKKTLVPLAELVHLNYETCGDVPAVFFEEYSQIEELTAASVVTLERYARKVVSLRWFAHVIAGVGRIGPAKCDVFVLGFADGHCRRAGSRSVAKQVSPPTPSTTKRKTILVLEQGMYSMIASNPAGREALGLVKRLGIPGYHLRIAEAKPSTRFVVKLDKRKLMSMPGGVLASPYVPIEPVPENGVPQDAYSLVRGRFGRKFCDNLLDAVAHAQFGAEDGESLQLSAPNAFPRLFANCRNNFLNSALLGGVKTSIFGGGPGCCDGADVDGRSLLSLPMTDVLLLQVLHKKGRAYSFVGGMEFLAKTLEARLAEVDGGLQKLRLQESHDDEDHAHNDEDAQRETPITDVLRLRVAGGSKLASIQFRNSVAANTAYLDELQEHLSWCDESARRIKKPDVVHVSPDSFSVDRTEARQENGDAERQAAVGASAATWREIENVDCVVCALPALEAAKVFAEMSPCSENAAAGVRRDSPPSITSQLATWLERTGSGARDCFVVTKVWATDAKSSALKIMKKALFSSSRSRGGGYYAASSSAVSCTLFQSRLFPRKAVKNDDAAVEQISMYIPGQIATEQSDEYEKKPDYSYTKRGSSSTSCRQLTPSNTPRASGSAAASQAADREAREFLGIQAEPTLQMCTHHKYGHPAYETSSSEERDNLDVGRLLRELPFDLRFVGRHFGQGVSPGEEIVAARKLVDALVRKIMVTLYYATWDADALRLAEALRKKAATLHGAGGPAAASIQFQDVDELEDDADLPDGIDNHAALPFATVKAKDVEIFVSKQEMAAKLANNNWAACDSLFAYFESLSQSVENAAKTKYKQAALEPGTTFGGATSGCCNPGRDYAQVSKQLGYTDTEVSHEANLGLGCGNPLSFADLQPGETVMDLGCGAGFDCFLFFLLAGSGSGPDG
eukprot:g11515.t1